MILDTFYLLFKSDSKQASNDIGELTKKIDALKSKGKSRSEQEDKDLKESIKRHKELSNEVAENTNQYVKMAEGITGVITAAISFRAISNGIFGTAADNSGLQVQADLIGQSTVNLKAYGQAAKDAGGNSEALTGYLQGLFERFSAVGLGSKIPEVSEVLGKIRNQLKIAGGDLGQRERIFQAFNVPQGLKPLLSLPDAEYDKIIARNLELAENTEKGAKIARAYAESWSEVENSLNTTFTAIGSEVLPAFRDINKELTSFFASISQNKEQLGYIKTGVEAIAVVIVAALIPALTSAGIAAATAAAPILAIAAVGIGAFKGAKAVYDYSATHGYNAKFQSPNSTLKASGENYKTSTESLEDPRNAGILQQIMKGKHADLINNGKDSLDFATKSQLGVGSGGGGKNLSVKTGDIHVHTNATDASGISNDITGELMHHIQHAISNLDDGMSY